jgi:D-mannonate dehydratase
MKCLTLCTGSLGADSNNDIPDIISVLGANYLLGLWEAIHKSSRK